MAAVDSDSQINTFGDQSLHERCPLDDVRLAVTVGFERPQK